MDAARVPRLRGRLRRVRRGWVRMGRVGVFVPWGCALVVFWCVGKREKAYEEDTGG